MRVFGKIFLVLFFLVFSLVNSGNANEIYSQNSIKGIHTSIPLIYENFNNLNFLTLPSDNQDAGFTSSTGENHFSFFQQYINKNDIQQKISKTNIIAILFKTEVNPNAP